MLTVGLSPPALAEDFHVIALDQRGHGDSDHIAPPAYGTRHYLADLQQFITTLRLHKPVLMGHSMGGHNSIIYATRHAQELAALILVDTDAAIPRQQCSSYASWEKNQPKNSTHSWRRSVGFSSSARDVHLVRKLRYLASFAFAERPDGKWTAKLDRKPSFASRLTAGHSSHRSPAPRSLSRTAQPAALP